MRNGKRSTFRARADDKLRCRSGVVAAVGGIPNAVRRSPQLTPYLLTGEPIPHHLLAAHIFTEVVPTNEVLPAALRWAAKLVDASPEAVWATKEHINFHKDGLGVSAVVDAALETEVSKQVYRGENIQEGLRAFVEVSSHIIPLESTLWYESSSRAPSFAQKRDPVWRDPALGGKSKL